MLENSSLLAVLLLLATHVDAQPTEAKSPCDAGVWRVTSEVFRPNAGASSNPATSSVTCLFDGRVEMAEYRDLGPGGQVRFRGVSFHAWEPDRSERTTLWLMLGDPGHTLLVEEMRDGVLHAEGAGVDRSGSFLERSTTTFDADGGYRFDMERSFDDGETWRIFNVIEARRESGEPPPEPERAPALTAALDAVGVEPSGLAALDGLAEVEALTEQVDGRTRRVIRFSARYARPDRWPHDHVGGGQPRDRSR